MRAIALYSNQIALFDKCGVRCITLYKRFNSLSQRLALSNIFFSFLLFYRINYLGTLLLRSISSVNHVRSTTVNVDTEDLHLFLLHPKNQSWVGMSVSYTHNYPRMVVGILQRRCNNAIEIVIYIQMFVVDALRDLLSYIWDNNVKMFLFFQGPPSITFIVLLDLELIILNSSTHYKRLSNRYFFG